MNTINSLIVNFKYTFVREVSAMRITFLGFSKDGELRVKQNLSTTVFLIPIEGNTFIEGWF